MADEARKAQKVLVKFRDKAGNTWTGRGSPPPVAPGKAQGGREA